MARSGDEFFFGIISSCFIVINHSQYRKVHRRKLGRKGVNHKFCSGEKVRRKRIMKQVHHFKKSISFQLRRIPELRELSKRSFISEIKNSIFIHRRTNPFYFSVFSLSLTRVAVAAIV